MIARGSIQRRASPLSQLAKGQKRKLVSLVEANEVAKRLASRERSVPVEDDDFVTSEETTGGDEVDAWFSQAISADH